MNDPEQFGMRLAMAHHRISFPQANVMQGMVNTLREDDSGAFDKLACAAAAYVYDLTGQRHKTAYHLFSKLAAYEGPWYQELKDLAGIALQGLGSTPQMVKRADIGLKDILGGIGGVAGMYPKLLLAASALGTAGGGLAWSLGHRQKEEETDDARSRAQIEFLNSMTNDIDSNLLRRGLISPDELEEDPRVL